MTRNCARVSARTHERSTMKSKLPRDILSLVNRKSHAAGVAYAELEKKRLNAELERLQAEGMGLQELQKYLNMTH